MSKDTLSTVLAIAIVVGAIVVGVLARYVQVQVAYGGDNRCMITKCVVVK